MGLVINENKTKYLKMSSAEHRRSVKDIEIMNFRFEGISNFVYLGSLVNNENKVSVEIDRRIMAANRAYFANLRLLKSKLLSRATKLRLYKSLIRPVVTYGAETWYLSQNDCRKLAVFERKVVRRICGATFVNGRWKCKTNEEVDALLKKETIINFVKTSRLRWAGHVARMERERMQSRVLEMELCGKRRRGRPRGRWKDEIDRDARKLGIRNWKREAQDRDRWRDLIRQAKGRTDL